MKTVKIRNKEYVFIEKGNIIVDGSDLVTYRNENGVNKTVILSDEKTKFITETNTITEEIAKTIVEDFRNSIFYNIILCKTPLESFYSLMDSLGLDRNKNYLLIEKL